MNKWANDEVCQQMEIERHNYYVWKKEELYFVDESEGTVTPWMQMASEEVPTVRYHVNPNYTMPSEK